MITVESFYEDIAQMSPADVEALIQGFSNEMTLALINEGRRRIIEDPQKEFPEIEARAAIILLRKHRAARAEGRAAGVKKPRAEPKPAMTLDSLFGSLEG